jgi:hypothetical protein
MKWMSGGVKERGSEKRNREKEEGRVRERKGE